MNYYKRSFRGGTEYSASSGKPNQIVCRVLQITVLWPSRYSIEHRNVFTYADYEPINKKEFEYEYQRAIETFNSILKPE